MVLYAVILIMMFFFQEKMIFFPEKLADDFTFSFEAPFEEINILTEDDVLLNGVLFKADTSKGLIFYLHGNGGSVRSWGEISGMYTDLNYDVFFLDYRSFGKSTGSISSQKQLTRDTQIAYDTIRASYDEDNVIVLGFSLGSGLAAKLASENNPKLLILQAPYYSMVDMMKNTYPLIPTFLLKYKLKTNQFIQECSMPVAIFHGDQDMLIPYESSVRLMSLAKDSDTLITMLGHGHHGIGENSEYTEELAKLLE